MLLDEWARKWGVPAQAIGELKRAWGLDHSPDVVVGEGSESRMQSLVRLEAAQLGITLTRNNVGVLLDKNDRPVRYGLFNESKQQNAIFKSPDVVGINPILIGPQHVGLVIGQFIARECKHEGWRYRGDKHEQAQLNCINFINSKGGDAAFAAGPGSFKK